jgi:PAS domain S-box-containing protein
MSAVIEVISELHQVPPADEGPPDREATDHGACRCSLIALTPYPMWIFDHATLKFLEVNQAAVSRYGYSRSEFLNMTILDIRPSEDVLPLLRNAIQHPNASQAESWRHTTKKGEVIHVEISSREVYFCGRSAKVVLAIETETVASRMLRILEMLDVNSNSTRHFCEGCTQKCSRAVAINQFLST